MSTKDKKSVASQALLEMDAITNALKEESKKSLNTLLAEAVKSALREGCENEEDEDEKEYDVIDEKGETEKKDQKGGEKKQPKKSESEAGNPDEMNPNADAEQVAGATKMEQPQDENPQMGGQMAAGQEGPQPGEMQQGADMPQGGEGEEDMAQGEEGMGDESWDEFSDYQVGDGNTYDLTGENDYDTVVKVYKLLNDDDQVVVKKDNNKIQLKDNEAGTEYVIDLGEVEDEESDMEEPEDMGGEDEMPEGLNESYFGEGDEFAGIEDDDEDPNYDGVPSMFGADHNDNPDWDGDVDWDPEEDDDEFDDEFEDDDIDFGGDDDSFEDENEIFESKGNNRNKKNKKPMRESKNNVLFEVDLGYTDNYQDKDPIAGLSNNEPAKGKKSWHKGVPTGTSKPWAGDSKSKGDPFKTTVNEEDDAAVIDNAMTGGTNNTPQMDETTLTTSKRDRRHSVHDRQPAGTLDEYQPEGTKKVSKGTQYDAVREGKELRAIKNENKELKKAIVELRKSLNEAYITNVNLGKITKLFLENATSQKEKIEIVNRFANEAKTLEQSKMLYESINKELKKGNKQTLNLNESSVTAKGTKELNEQKIYKSDDLLKTIDFMNRVLDC